jgi:Uncharacterised nucleotidyltransferase
MPPLPFHALDLTPDEATRRFRWARARGLPRWLWPDLPVPLFHAASADLLRATAQVLAGRPAVLDAEGRIGAEALGVAAFLAGTGPLLGHWIERGALRADDGAAALLALHLAHGRARAERLAAVLDDALAVLAAAGVECIVAKGMHTARALFPEPGVRPMTDVDLVVPPARVDDAERALAAAGYVRQGGEYQRRPYHADWRPPGADGAIRSLALMHRDNPLVVNLRDGFDRHTAVGRVRLGWPGADETVPMPGVRTPASVLAGPFLVAQLAAHASEQRGNLLPVRIVELVLAFRAGVDAAALRGFLRERRIGHHVYPALALAERLAPGTVDAALLRFVEDAAGPRLRRAVAAIDPAEVQQPDRPVAGGRALAMRGPGDAARAALHWLLPFTAPRRLAAVYRARLARILRARPE